MKTTLTIRTLLVLSFLLTVGALSAQSGTTDGVYNFGSLGVLNSGGTGFRTQGDKFKVSNVFAQDRKSIYVDNANAGEAQTIIIKAEGTTTNKSFTFKDLVVKNFALNTAFDVFTITLRNYAGAQIAKMTLTGNQLLGPSVQPISTFAFDTPFPAAGYNGVAEIQVDFHYADASISPDELTFYTIKIANVTSTILLPLSLLDFTVKEEGSGVRINWVTANEVNVAQQVIEHSADGFSFTPVATFSGRKNSTAKNYYTYLHSNPSKGKNYYRLKEVDVNGAEKIYVVRMIEIGKKADAAIQITSSFNGSFYIQNMASGTYNINLIDLNGRVLQSAKVSNPGSNYQLPVPATVPKGTYVLTVTSGSQSFSQKIIR